MNTTDYRVKRAHQKTRAFKEAQIAARDNKDPRRKYFGIVVNNELELVVETTNKGDIFSVALCSFDKEKTLTEEESTGIYEGVNRLLGLNPAFSGPIETFSRS